MTRMTALTLGIVGALALVGGGVGQAAGPVTVRLTGVGGSNEAGTAVLSEDGAKTKVVVAINGQPANTSHPAHIHKGTCAQFDPKPAYPLTDVSAGKAESIVDVPLTMLQTGGFVINGHKSSQDMATHVFCGNIPGQ